MLTMLSEATRTDAGGKAATLGALLRAGLPVPDGFVLPSGIQQTGTEVECALRDAVARGLERMGRPGGGREVVGDERRTVQVRGRGPVRERHRCARRRGCVSGDRDLLGFGPRHASGRLLGLARVTGRRRLRACQCSCSRSSRPMSRGGMFTPQRAGGPTRIQACWGLGLPSSWAVRSAPAAHQQRPGTDGFSAGSKQTRVDLDHERGGVVTSAVTPGKQLHARSLPRRRRAA